jgi:3-(3-hydroxy-phenyl)propionate hydroxylase
MGPVAYIFDPDEWVIVMKLPDMLRIVFRLRRDEDAEAVQAEGAVRRRVSAFLGSETPWTAKGTWVYRIHQRVAETFRAGRILLAGDAAHINIPTGGMGMNSGVHDAHRLVGALTRALRDGDESDLDAYAAERRAAAMERVQQTSNRTYVDLVATEPEAIEARNRELARAAADPRLARAYLLRASMLEDRIEAGVLP